MVAMVVEVAATEDAAGLGDDDAAAEVGVAEAGAAEVGVAEVGVAEVGGAETGGVETGGAAGTPPLAAV